MSHQIHTANYWDIKGIYELMVEAFDESYLSYTIYQSPKSVQHLSSLISETEYKHKNHLMVLSDNYLIRGYYHAIINAECFFLNYIAVARAFTGQGLGYSLLSHYEDTGMKLGCTQFGLDVFERNQLVQKWYMKYGYKQVATSYFAHVGLGFLNRQSCVLVCEQAEWDKAHEEEMIKGFSKITFKVQQGFISLGLINGKRCKLLGYEGITFDDALIAVNNYLVGKGRETLIVVSASPLANTWPIVQQDRIFRLVKNV